MKRKPRKNRENRKLRQERPEKLKSNSKNCKLILDVDSLTKFDSYYLTYIFQSILSH